MLFIQVLFYRLDESDARSRPNLVETKMTLSDVRRNPFEFDETEAYVLVVILLATNMNSTLVMPTSLAAVTTETILVGCLRINERLDESVTIQRKSCELTQDFKELALDLPVLDPDLFEVDAMAPFSLTRLTGREGIIAVRSTIGLCHDGEHIVAEVALPLINVRVAGNLL